MTDRLREALGAVVASPALKQKTREQLVGRIERGKVRRPIPVGALAACAAVLMFAVGGWRMWSIWNSPVSYVSVDVNPSIELTLNGRDRVIAAQAFGEEGAVLLAGLSLRSRPHTEAVTLLLQSEENTGYLQRDALVSFTVRSDDEAREGRLLSELEQSAQTVLPGVQVMCATAEGELWQQAHAHGLSAGKYRMILCLMELDDTATVEECRHHSMRQLQDLLDTCLSHGEQMGHHGNQGGRRGGHHGN